MPGKDYQDTKIDKTLQRDFYNIPSLECTANAMGRHERILRILK